MNYIWGGPRTTVVPRSVQSRVAIFDGEADARQAMEMRGELLRFMVGLTPQEFTDLESFGHDAVLFRSDGYDLPPQAGVLWRNGNMLALVYAGGEGMSAEQASKAAPELARKQQDRIERPRPAEPRPKKDPELPLDDPTLSVPVYWLGRTFSPGGGLPTLSFARSYAGAGVPELGFTVEVDYDTESRQTEGVKLWVFHPDAFDRFEKGILGRLVTAASCSSPTKREIPGGHVVIWSGYAKPTRGTCPTGSYDRYVGYIHLRDAVVTVNQPWCLYPCGAPFHAAPYQSVDGVMAIARGLQVRKPR